MTGAAGMLLGGLAGLVALVAAATAARHPVARRLAVRSARRRPAETVLVTLGALLGTAIITGSLVVGDSLSGSIEAGAFTQLGPVDETVTAPGTESLPALREALSGLERHDAVDGVAFGLRSRGTAGARVGGADAAVQPGTLLLELDLDEAGALGDRPEATGLHEAATPAAGEAAISADLAEALDVGRGDPLTVFAHGSRSRLEIAAVLPRVGLAGYTTGLDARSFTVFLAPGTLDQLAGQAPDGLEASPPIALALVSNQGDVLAGAQRTDRVTGLLRERIATVPRSEVTADKRQLLDRAEETASSLTEIFLSIGAFAVVAGILLLVNVFVMLAQERRGELGILRAVGMRRAGLVRAFSLEGSLYAVAAAVLGAAGGIGVGAAIMQLARGISAGPAGATLDFRFTVDAASVLGGLLTGLLISLLTVAATSVRISRLTIVRAIRELPEPPREGRRVPGLVAGWLATLGGAAVTVAALAAGAGTGLLLGPAVLAGGLVAVLGPGPGRRRVVTLLGLLVVAWGVAAPTLLPDAFHGAQAGVFVVQGLTITGAAVVVLSRNQAALGRLVRRAVGGGGSLPVRLGLAEPLARPFRTTMTLAMYALVVFTLVFVSLLAQVLGGQVDAFTEAEAGGHDLLVTSAESDPLPPEEVRELAGVEAVAPLDHAAFSVEFRAPGQDRFRRWFASGFDRRLLESGPPALDRWLPGLADEQAAWQHVLEDPSTMIVGSQFLQDPQQPVEVGDVVALRDRVTGTTVDRRVAGVMQGGLAYSGAFLSRDSLRAVLGPTATTNRLYVAVDRRVDPGRLAATIESEHLDHGVEARTFRAIVAARQQDNQQFLRILQGYLMLGVLVGTAGLGVVMVRAVRERRQQIGVLRSVGVQAAAVRRAFVVEAAFVALQGIAVGAALATATAYQLITNADAFGGLEVRFVVPWAELAVLLTATLAVAVAATLLPARQAARIPPAVALRGAE